jgi:RNA-binding protein Nova
VGLNHNSTSVSGGSANASASSFGGSPNNNRSSHNVSDRLAMPDNFDPFKRSSPSLGSPSSQTTNQQVNANGTSTGPNGGVNSHQLPAVVNNNSFGLGLTGSVMNTSSSPLRKSPTQNDHNEVMTNVEVEIGDNIVGAILGHKGTAIVEIQRISGANIQISKKGIFAPGTRNRIVTISGTPNSVSAAQFLIEQQLSEEEVRRQRVPPTLNSVLR